MKKNKSYKKKNSNTVLTSIFSLLLVLLIVGGLAYLSKGFKDWNYKDWFNKSDDSNGEMIDEPQFRQNEARFNFRNDLYGHNEELGDFISMVTLDATPDVLDYDYINLFFEHGGVVSHTPSTSWDYAFVLQFNANYSFNRIEIIYSLYYDTEGENAYYVYEPATFNFECTTLDGGDEETSLVTPTLPNNTNVSDTIPSETTLVYELEHFARNLFLCQKDGTIIIYEINLWTE
ncbi:MAG: hypothetical protein LBV51_02645 [Acholeplasmatales bacterium]|jgi:hypothetical protein|nr:hypothetical protein [Acholeplasmatales bacterium]